MRDLTQKTKHEGKYLYRLSPQAGNPREVAFSELWTWENTERPGLRNGVLEYLLGDGHHPVSLFEDQPFDRHAAMVAATVVQWLGSEVGFSFLEHALDKCGYKIIKQGSQQWLKTKHS
jgi:hypothetical protein